MTPRPKSPKGVKAVEVDIDAEVMALGLAVDAFNMVDRATAFRLLRYLESRFIDGTDGSRPVPQIPVQKASQT